MANMSDAEKLAEALLCDDPAMFAVSWHGNVMLSSTLAVSNGSTLNVTVQSKSIDTDTGGTKIVSYAAVVVVEVDLGLTVSLTSLTLSGGDGAPRVTGESFIDVIGCNFTYNNITSPDLGGRLVVLLSLYMPPRTPDRSHQIFQFHFLTVYTTFDQNSAFSMIKVKA